MDKISRIVYNRQIKAIIGRITAMCIAKRVLALALCVVLAAGGLLLGGCSTPDVALTVDDVTYEMGDYLAYLYTSYYNIYYNRYLYYYEQMGTDVMSQTFTYNEQTLKLEDYLKRVTVDTMVRQKAVSDLLKKYGLSVSEDKVKELEKNFEGMTDTSKLDPMTGKSAIDMGFTLKRYIKASETYSLNENALFYGLYDKGGERAVADDKIRSYFDDNYLSYKIIEVTMQDDKKADLDEAGQKKIKDNLNKYLEQYKKSDDFDAVIAQYNKDTDTSSSTTTASGSATTSTAASTTATTADATTESTTGTTKAQTSDSSADDKTDGEEEEEEETDPNRKNTTVESAGDEDFTNALKKVPVGEAQVITYKKGSTTLTAALVLRLDPEKGLGAYTFEDERENVIYGIAYEEFNKEVEEVIAKLTVKENKRAIRMATIKDFRG